jgi:hypothetical protein
MKPYELTQRREICDHPEKDCIQSDAGVTGMFTIWCQKCDTTFNRYEYPEILKNRKKYGKKHA